MRIRLSHIEYSKDDAKILRRITCSFSNGITYVVGKNGVGKSTLLKLIATAISPDQGLITYTKLVRDEKNGVYRQQLNVDEVRKIIGFMPQHFTGHLEMTVERYLTYMAFHKGIPHTLVKSIVRKWLQDTHLVELKRKKLKTLSGGQLQKVGLIQALINQPRICILDEPFEGLDMEEKLLFKRIIERHSFHSIIIISTHLLEEIGREEDGNIFHMNEGKVSFYGGMDGLDGVLKSLTTD